MRTYTDRDLRMLVARSSVSSHGEHRAPLNLAGADLEMANLPYVDLCRANLKGANLRGADLRGASLRGAKLCGAKLDKACLDAADLTGSDLTWSDLCGCSMKGTRLVDANLDEALVDWGALADAVTTGAMMTTLTFTGKPTRQMLVGRSEADVVRAMFGIQEEGAHRALQKQSDSGSKLGPSQQPDPRVLSDDDLQDLLRWSASTGKPLNLRGCNLAGADLRNASFRGACLAFTNATAAAIDGADLTGADLEGACGWERP